ncbi:MAG: 5-formyltetrahydrofolate cyclo-ligase [Campylobacterota bacterium]|nr:5-formyltetrahydrofolate cyclo-ligase [Campylobacterota bacterium]
MSLTKAKFRQECLYKIRNASRHNKIYKDALLVKKLEKIIQGLHVKSVLMYWPLPFEANITKLLHVTRRRTQVYLPFMEGESFKMVAYRLPMERKSFGIFEPGQSLKKIKNIDIAIVPAVGVDGRARRIGFGKGMYDRFFEKLPNRPKIIFVQSQMCKTTKNICDHYDISADLLVTPRRCYGVRGTYNVKRDAFRRSRCRI